MQRVPNKVSWNDFSWGFAFVGGTEIYGQAHLSFELRVADPFAFEAQSVERCTGHVLEGGAHEPADLRVGAADGKGNAVCKHAHPGFLEAVFALQQFEVCGTRETIHALKLVGELLQRRKQAIKAA